MESSSTAILMNSLTGGSGAGVSGVRTAINKMIVGFIPYHEHPYFGYVLMGIGGALFLWLMSWYWFNFIR
jgi:hypothetical protein